MFTIASSIVSSTLEMTVFETSFCISLVSFRSALMPSLLAMAQIHNCGSNKAVSKLKIVFISNKMFKVRAKVMYFLEICK